MTGKIFDRERRRMVFLFFTPQKNKKNISPVIKTGGFDHG